MPKSFIKGGSKLRQFIREAKKGGVKNIQVGIFADSKYPDGTPVATVAAVNEFGSGAIKERPAFRQGIRDIPAALAPLFKVGFKRTLVLDRPFAKRIGETAADVLKASYVRLRSPGNKPSTLLKKSGSNPLLDTKTLIKSLKSRVIG